VNHFLAEPTKQERLVSVGVALLLKLGFKISKTPVTGPSRRQICVSKDQNANLWKYSISGKST
jgi:hypothetical protein